MHPASKIFLIYACPTIVLVCLHREGVRELLQAVAACDSAKCSQEERDVAGWRCALCLEILNRFLNSCEV